MRRTRLTRNQFLKAAGAAGLALPALAAGLPGANRLVQNAAPPRTQTGRPPNFLIMVFDAMSARNLSLYGYPRPTTPNLERLARRAIVYRRHIAAGTFTSPGTASLLTGDYPWKHRALQMRSQALPEYAGRNLFSRLPTTYYKFAYTQNPLAYALLDQIRDHIHNLPHVAEVARLDATFAEDLFYTDYYAASEAESLILKEKYDPPASLFLSLLDRMWLGRQNADLAARMRKEYPRGPTNCRPANPGLYCFTLEDAMDWTIQTVKNAPQPYCGYVHVFPPHAPYNPRAEFAHLFDDDYQPENKPEFVGEATHTRRTLTRYRRFYDQSIAHVDAEFERLMNALAEAGSLENTYVILTSDHGEMLERGVWGHVSSAMYAPLVEVPLVVFAPGASGRTDVTTTTSAVDLVPTLLRLADSAEARVEGAILPAMGSGADDRPRFVIDAKTNSRRGPLQAASFAVIAGPDKLIRYSGLNRVPDREELYNLDQDPEELKDLFHPQDPTARRLSQFLDEQLSLNGTGEPVE